MFKKVLIAEDVDAVNTAVKQFLLNLGVKEVVYAPYCDEAYLKFRRGILDNSPFNLIICDLSFRQDHRIEKISSGDELAKIIKKEDPKTKIIIHSIEDQPGRANKIISYVDAYVCKGRNGLKYLEEAIDYVFRGEKYLSPDIQNSLQHNNVKELSDYEISLLKYLSQGYTQEKISENFRRKGLAPYSKSSIEKKLKDLREEFGATTNPQLISMVMTLQII